MVLSFKQKLFYFLPVLFCFCLPFGRKIDSWLIIGWVFVSFFNIEPARFKEGLKNRNLQLMILFFILTVVSAIFSSNKYGALFSIEVKLSFLFFPYLLFCFTWPVQILKRCVVAFVSGCFFVCVFLIARAGSYAYVGHSEYFFYTNFSYFLHASYFAMYLVTALFLMALFYKRWFSAQKPVMFSVYFFAAVFVITIFLCASKLGIISFFVIMPLVLIYKLKERINFKTIIVLISAVVLVLIAALYIFPDSFSRLRSISALSTAPDKTSSESTAVRVLIWEQSITLIKENFLFGTGIGDVNDVLYKAYKENGLTGALDHKLNAHNQFLQTFIGLGVFGFVLLLLLTIGQFIKSLLRKNVLLFLFMSLIILNFLVESMLQTAAGILYFSFFFCLYNLTNEKELLSE
jgi:O-antigen ligase